MPLILLKSSVKQEQRLKRKKALLNIMPIIEMPLETVYRYPQMNMKN